VVPNAVSIFFTVLLIAVIPHGGRSIITGITDQNYFYFYFGAFLLQGICLAVAVRLKFITNGIPSFLSVFEFRLLFSYCALAFVGNILHLLLYRLDYYFVEKYCTAAQLGNYIQVSKLANLFFILPTILASAVFPLTASGQKTGIIKTITLLSRCLFISYLFICLLLILAGKWLFPFVFGNSFSGMYQPFIFLVPGILALSGIFTITAYFAGNNQIKHNITGSVLALLVIFTGDIIWIPKYGINAAAMVSSIGYLVYQVYVILVINREFNTKLSDFFLFRIRDIGNLKKLFRKQGNLSA
jgi:O-antigen/teichoic acid export membrane protein